MTMKNGAKFLRGIDLSFQNWHKEFDRFWPKHPKVSKRFHYNGLTQATESLKKFHFNGLFLIKVTTFELKITFTFELKKRRYV